MNESKDTANAVATEESRRKVKSDEDADVASRASGALLALRHSALITDAEQKVLDRAANIRVRIAHESRNGGKRRRL